jgi:uncharacterized protein
VTEKTFRVTQDDVRFALRLTPRGGRDAIDGWAESAGGTSHLKARVSVAPEAGKANAALIALLAKRLGVAKSRVAIVGGETARMKIVDIAGDGAALAAVLNALGERQ